MRLDLPATHARAAAAGGHVGSVDAQGVPQFIWAVDQAAPPKGVGMEGAAFLHLSRFKDTFKLTDRDLAQSELLQLRTLPEGGAVAVYGQRVEGMEVYPSKATLLMKKTGELVAVGGNLKPLPPASILDGFVQQPGDALALALSQHFHVALTGKDFSLHSTPVPHDLRFVTAGRSLVVLSQPARVKSIIHAGAHGMEAAYFIEFFAQAKGGVESEAYRYILAAKDGRLLERRNLTAQDAFQYRVWAEPTPPFAPLDGATGDVTPSLTGLPTSPENAFVPGNLVVVEGLQFPNGQVAPWLPSGAVESVGNNVDAYTDQAPPDGFSNDDLRAVPTAPNSFDWAYAFDQPATSTVDQALSGVTNLFYMTNWLHDWWYQAGLTEAAGNAQKLNGPFGGVGGDPLLAEAQDNVAVGAANNANMATPADGMSPRMQVYVFQGPSSAQAQVAGAPQPLNVGLAAFGPNNFDVTADLVVADDGVPVVGDACSPLVNNVAGKIALVARGTCSFATKAAFVEAAGAVGMLVTNNAPGVPAPSMGGAGSVNIAVLSVSLEDGDSLRTGLAMGPVSITLKRFTGVTRDGALDNLLIAHEYGHYVHQRLANCGAVQCAGLSEGWGDFSGLLLAARDGDDLTAAYPAAGYATAAFPAFSVLGLRRMPYSVDPAFNPLSFRHISDGEPLPEARVVALNGQPNSEVHNVGEIWASMLWEAAVPVLRQANAAGPTFQELKQRLAGYVVTAHQLSPLNATFTESRDAVLAAAMVNHPEDAALMAAAFARRGAGSCAVSPDRSSQDMTGVTESNVVAPQLAIIGVGLVDDLRTCDRDGYLDGDEAGLFYVAVANVGHVPLSGAHVTVSSPTPGVTFPDGAVLAIPDLAPFTSVQVAVKIAVSDTLTGVEALELVMDAADAGACAPAFGVSVTGRINADEVLGSPSDDVETAQTSWTTAGTPGPWSRQQVAALDTLWHGSDAQTSQDSALVSPVLHVGTGAPLVISFDHRFAFEVDATTTYDGSVLEFTTDGGTTWQDVSTLVAPGYTGTISDCCSNPLATRPGFIGANAAWPELERLTLNLGMGLAGLDVQVRFRMATDLGTAVYGWDVDNVLVEGSTNAPFFALMADQAVCLDPFTAHAGEDAMVLPASVVVLDGSQTEVRTNSPLTFTWTQVSGPTVQVSDVNLVQAAFVAPSLEAGAVLVFQFTVTDGVFTSLDTVEFTVGAVAAPVLTANAGMPSTAHAGTVVTLDASRSSTTGAVPLTFMWSQSSGTNVTLTNANSAVATFEAPYLATGEDLVFKLLISDGTHSATGTVTTTVVGHTLNANAGQAQTSNPGATVVLDGSASSSSVGDALTFVWTQTAGPAVTLANGDRAVASFQAPFLDADTVLGFSLKVSDGARSSTATVDATVRGYTLLANAGAGQTVDANAQVVLDGSTSRSSTGLPLTFIWTQTAGPSVTLSQAATAVARFTAPAPAADTTLTFQLSVGDGTRTTQSTVDVMVKAVVVPGLTSNAGAAQTVDASAQVFLDGSASSSTAGLALTYMWTQTAGPTVSLVQAGSAVANFRAPAPAADTTLTFQLAVGDGTRTAQSTVNVLVKAVVVPGLTAFAGMDQSVEAGATVALDGSGSRSTANLPLTYGWTQVVGASVMLSSSGGAVATFKAPLPLLDTALTFELTVQDGTLTRTDRVVVNVRARVVVPVADAGSSVGAEDAGSADAGNGAQAAGCTCATLGGMDRGAGVLGLLLGAVLVRGRRKSRGNR